MPTFTEPKHEGEFVGESCMSLAYLADDATIAVGQTLEPGHVLGKVAASSEFSALDPVAETGTEDAAGLALKATDTSAGAANALVIVRGPLIVNDNDLTWPAGITPQQKATAISQLMALRIRVA